MAVACGGTGVGVAVGGTGVAVGTGVGGCVGRAVGGGTVGFGVGVGAGPQAVATTITVARMTNTTILSDFMVENLPGDQKRKAENG
jgi:hypothetical protein